MLCSSNEFQIRDGLHLISDTVNSSASYPTVLGSTMPDADLTDRGTTNLFEFVERRCLLLYTCFYICLQYIYEQCME